MVALALEELVVVAVAVDYFALVVAVEEVEPKLQLMT
jgi:hypothetical protein